MEDYDDVEGRTEQFSPDTVDEELDDDDDEREAEL